MASFDIGEGFVGDGVDAAHVNTVLGPKDGPAGVAWATALATPSAGHVPFIAILRPGLAVKPLTLFVTKAAIAGPRHGDLTWGAAQAGVAGGVADALADDTIPAAEVDAMVLIAAVWVNPEAADAGAVYRNNREATYTALRNGVEGKPDVQHVLAARHRPWNPFFANDANDQEPVP